MGINLFLPTYYYYCEIEDIDMVFQDPKYFKRNDGVNVVNLENVNEEAFLPKMKIEYQYGLENIPEDIVAIKTETYKVKLGNLECMCSYTSRIIVEDGVEISVSVYYFGDEILEELELMTNNISSWFVRGEYTFDENVLPIELIANSVNENLFIRQTDMIARIEGGNIVINSNVESCMNYELINEIIEYSQSQ